jgi:hypothetical protein
LSIYLPDKETKAVDYIAFAAEPTPVRRLNSFSRQSGCFFHAVSAYRLLDSWRLPNANATHPSTESGMSEPLRPLFWRDEQIGSLFVHPVKKCRC